MNCFMCLESSNVMLNIILDKFSYCPITIIKNYFWFTPSIDNPMICANCWNASENFHIFYLKIQKAHRKLMEIEQQIDSSSFKNCQTESFSEVQEFKDCKVSFIKDSLKNCTDSNDSNCIQSDGAVKTDLSASNLKNICDEDEAKNTKIELNRNSKDIEFDMLVDLDNCLQNDKKVTNFLTFNCSLCSLILSTFEELKTHFLRVHNIKGYAKCCNQKYYKRQLLVNHISTHINAEHFKCSNCLKSFKTQKSYTDHLKSFCHVDFIKKGENVEVKLDIDNKILNTLKSRKDDEKVASFVTLSCSICSLILPTFGKLKTHFTRTHNANGYAMCCNRKYYKRNLLIDHINTHINPEHFKCLTCSKTFTNKKSHTDHIKSFHKDETVKYSCNQCNKKFSSTKTLSAHRKTHRPKEEWKFKCSYAECDKTFASREFLSSHVHSVHKKITKICDLCGKTLNSNTFRKHMQKHSGVVQEKIQCHICNSFFHKKYIKIHLKNHEEANKEHLCPTCGKKSPNGKALYKHIYEVHRIRKAHPCTVCKKLFRSKDLLLQHIPVHTGENNFKCIVCNRLFKFKSNLYEHKKKEHPIELEKERENRKRKYYENQIANENNLENILNITLHSNKK